MLMTYLDYSATTFVNDEVLTNFNEACKSYRGNPNSAHDLGVRNKKRIDKATNNVARLLGVEPSEIIYTSGASEANNLAIKGVCKANKGKHIITTPLEHSSVIASINRLCLEGYEVDFVKLRSDGSVDLNNLKSLIRNDTVLMSVALVDSELGIKQDVNKISEVLKGYPNCFFHVDATQAVGKTNFDFKNVDLVSFSAHKFFGIKGIGCLIKKQGVKIEPQIDGGKSTTKYRSGTPALELIVSLEKALCLALENFDEKLEKVKLLSNEVKEFLRSYKDVVINNTNKSIYQIVNFSMLNGRANEMIALLNEREVYVSSKSACSSQDSLSKTVMKLYDDEKRANNSVRVSISYVTTKEDIDTFKKIFSECYERFDDKCK